MFLFRTFASGSSLLGSLAAAGVAALLLTAQPASAHDAKNIGWFSLPPGQTASVYKAPATPAAPQRAKAPGPLVAIIHMEPEAAPNQVFVAVRGPDGVVRNFPLEGGLEVIRSGEVIVHAGETATIRIVAAAPPK
jgi:hypothetical protein